MTERDFKVMITKILIGLKKRMEDIIDLQKDFKKQEKELIRDGELNK